MEEKESELQQVESELRQLSGIQESYNATKHQLDMAKHEMDLVKRRLQHTTQHRQQEEVNEIKQKIGRSIRNICLNVYFCGKFIFGKKWVSNPSVIVT